MSYGYGTPHNAPPYGRGPPGGGFATAPSGPPPGADPQLWSWFAAVDLDRSGVVSAPELQRALINGDWSPFDLDTVKLLMNIFDTDRSGTIGFNEFAGLWKYIKDWQGVFRHFDRDNSGSIDGSELADALRQFGYNLSPQLLTLLERKYGLKGSIPSAGGAPAFPGGPGAGGHYGRGPPAAAGGITFDRFVRACVVVKQITEAFARLDTDRDGWVQISYDQFLQTVLELP